jgi:Tfp pilus assembly protein FimT
MKSMRNSTSTPAEFAADRRARSRRGTAGFTLVEVAVSTLVMLILAAIAIPSIVQSLKIYRLSGATQNVALLLQRARYEAIRSNTTVNFRTQTLANTAYAWIDLNGDGVMDATEPTIQISSDMRILAVGAVPNPATMGYANLQTAVNPISFDPRGTVNFGGGPIVVNAIYLGFPLQPTYGFRAVTLTPMGQVKIWSAAQGGNWHSP